MTPEATYKELRRSRSDRMVAGVCGGLGRYFDVNPTFYRVGFVVLAVLGGAGILIYGAALLVMPDEGEEQSVVTEILRDHRKRPWATVGLVLIAIGGAVLLAHARIWPHGSAIWVLLLLGGAVLLWSQMRRESQTSDEAGPEERPAAEPPSAPAAAVTAEPAPRRRSLFAPVLGGLVIAGGILALLAAAGVDVPWAIVLDVAAVAVGAIVIVGALLDQRVGGLVLPGIALAIGALVASTLNLHLADGVGNRNYAPLTVAGVSGQYKLGVGNLDVDLSRLALPPGETKVAARLGVGELHVTVPAGTAVFVSSHVGIGESDLLGEQDNGRRVNDTVTRPGSSSGRDAKLLVDAHVGIGQVRVTRAVR